jgi:beta-mannosidase
MFKKEFAVEHPDLIHHFVEYQPDRVPRMLSRASHIDDMTKPTLEALSEGTQIGAGEFYQIFSEITQANWPVTAGLLPWVFKRPWPTIGVMLVDGMGHPTAPYYFLKRTYEPTHVMVKLPELMWAKGESLPVHVSVLHAPPSAERLQLSVEILDPAVKRVWHRHQSINVLPGPSVQPVELGKFTIPDNFEEHFFFVVAELHDGKGQRISRSVYWPRCLARMSDEAFRTQYRSSPQPALTFDKGPWLKPQVAAVPTSLEASVEGVRNEGADRVRLVVRVRNAGQQPAVNVRVDITGTRCSFCGDDNFFWLAPGESRDLEYRVLWRDPASRDTARLTVEAWNAQPTPAITIH